MAGQGPGEGAVAPFVGVALRRCAMHIWTPPYQCHSTLRAKTVPPVLCGLDARVALVELLQVVLLEKVRNDKSLTVHRPLL